MRYWSLFVIFMVCINIVGCSVFHKDETNDFFIDDRKIWIHLDTEWDYGPPDENMGYRTAAATLLRFSPNGELIVIAGWVIEDLADPKRISISGGDLTSVSIGTWRINNSLLEVEYVHKWSRLIPVLQPSEQKRIHLATGRIGRGVIFLKDQKYTLSKIDPDDFDRWAQVAESQK